MATMATLKKPARAMTKGEIVTGIADVTGLTKKDVNAVFEAMAAQVKIRPLKNLKDMV